MPKWNFNISKAPQGSTRTVPCGEGTKVLPVRDWVMTYSKCGQLIYTHYISEEQRWNCYAKGELPVAWMGIDKPDV